MIQEDKELLLIDLCARLPYSTKIEVVENDSFCSIEELDCYYLDQVARRNKFYSIKTYLFPLSSMTEDQKEEYLLLQNKIIYNGRGFANEDIIKYLNWCYKNHVDINNLIPKGLANDATGLGIY